MYNLFISKYINVRSYSNNLIILLLYYNNIIFDDTWNIIADTIQSKQEIL